MKRQSLLIMCSAAVVAIAALSPVPARAQEKTVKACEEEWRANKDANQAAKITEKAYVEKCRAVSAKPAAATTTAPAVAAPAKPAAPAATPASAQQKTVKACEEEWRANKEANQAAKITEKAYVEKCRAESAKPAAATTTPAKPAAAPAATAPTQAPAVAAPAKPAAPTPAATAPAIAKAGANQYATEAEARARCPSDTVVYVNLSSKIYHFAGHKDYGTLKKGTYMCEKDTAGAGARAAKNEKRP